MSTQKVTIVISLRAILAHTSSKPGSLSASPSPSPILGRSLDREHIHIDKIKHNSKESKENDPAIFSLKDQLNIEEIYDKKGIYHLLHQDNQLHKPKVPPPPLIAHQVSGLTPPSTANLDVHNPIKSSHSIQIPKDSSQTVYYKYDGSRFTNQQTFKILTGGFYEFYVLLKPERLQLSAVRIDEDATNFTEIDSITKSKLHFMGINETNMATNTIYSFGWNTENYNATKTTERNYLHLTLEILELGTFEAVLQLKLYPTHNKHHINWGEPLHYMEYHCELNPDTKKLLPYAFNIK